MSGGTPAGGGFVRQRYNQGYSSSGDDLEDDACSRTPPLTPPIPLTFSWIEVAQNVLWILSAVFIVYLGDMHSNLLHILWRDNRIRRTPLYLGMVGVVLNVMVLFYTSLLAWYPRKSDEKWEVISPSTAPFLMLVGLISFCLLSFALWPIWSFLTIPLLFTLFMACMVISPYLMPGTFRPQTNVLRSD